ncbi:aspartic peptidase domain-containing protein [Mycena capillaripes]|nr:aspartic peptidase domain-containing protein [Mycena capillaripes]
MIFWKHLRNSQVFSLLSAITVACFFISDAQADLGEGANALSRQLQHATISRRSPSVGNHLAAAERIRKRYGFTDGSNTSLQRRASPQDINVASSLGADTEDPVLYDTVYYMNVSIGTPAQTFLMHLDTAFPDIWVAAPCDVFDCPTGIPLYDSTKSSTAVNKSTSATTVSLDPQQAVNGYIFTDTIRLGSYSISNAAFLTLGPESPLPAPLPCSGSLGLGFAPIARTTNLPFWRAILQEQGSAEFSVWLSRIDPKVESHGGALTFGGVNNSLFSGDIEYLDLTDTNSTYWALNVSAVTVQGKSVGLSNHRLAVFDTSSLFIFAPATDMDAIWAAVPGSTYNHLAGFYQYPCTTDMNLTMSFGGRAWSINSKDLNLGPVSPGSQQCYGALTTNGGDNRYHYPLPDVDWVIGVPFFTNVYSVFRQTPPSMGFAVLSPAAGGPAPANSSVPTSSSTSTSPSSTSNGQTDDKTHVNVGAIAGGSIAGVIALLAAAFAFYCWRRRRRQNAQTLEDLQFSGPTDVQEHMSVPHPYPVTQSSFTQSLSMGKASMITSPSSGVQSTHRSEPTIVDGRTSVQVSLTQLPLGAQAPALSPSVSSDPAILQALESLRMEVREVRWLATEGMQPPPGYATE